MNEIWSNTQTSIAVSVLLIALSGLCSGLALGILSLDCIDIEIIKRSGNQFEKRRAIQIEPLLHHPHHVLVTLLLCNTAATEALPIFLNNFLTPLQSIVISVSAMLAFGEILPQAVCKRYGLVIGALFAYPVKIMMILTFPVSWPISKILDYCLGETTALFRRAELQALVTLHGESRETDAGNIRDGAALSRKISLLTTEEVQIIHGALDMAHKTAETAMTPLEHVFMVSSEDTLNQSLLQRIIDCGHSRIPVYYQEEAFPTKPAQYNSTSTSNTIHAASVAVQCTSPASHQPKTATTNIRGILLVKELLLLNTSKESIKVKDFDKLRDIDFILSSTPLYAVLDVLRCKCRHMAVVVQDSTFLPCASNMTPITNVHHVDQHPIGIITIEDVLEELLQQEIVDETDKWIDNTKTHGVPPLTPGGTAVTMRIPTKLLGWMAKRRKRRDSATVRSSSAINLRGVDAGAALRPSSACSCPTPRNAITNSSSSSGSSNRVDAMYYLPGGTSGGYNTNMDDQSHVQLLVDM